MAFAFKDIGNVWGHAGVVTAEGRVPLAPSSPGLLLNPQCTEWPAGQERPSPHRTRTAQPRTSTAPRVRSLGLGSRRRLTLTHPLTGPGCFPHGLVWHHWKPSSLGPPSTSQGHRGQPGLAGGERRPLAPTPRNPACSLLASRGSSTVCSIATPPASASWPPVAPGSCGGSDTRAALHLCRNLGQGGRGHS